MKKRISQLMLTLALAGTMVAPTFMAPAYAGQKAPAVVKNVTKKDKEAKVAPEVTKLKEKDDNGAVFTEFAELSHRDYRDKITHIFVNKKEVKEDYKKYEKPGYEKSLLHGLIIHKGGLVDGKNEILIKATGYKDKEITIQKLDNVYELISQKDLDTPQDTPGEQPEETQKPDPKLQPGAEPEKPAEGIKNPTEDGDYTLYYSVKQTGTQKDSAMVKQAFDKRIKLTVSGGKMKISLLNNALVSSLIDATVGIDNHFKTAKKTGFGETNAHGEYNAYEYTSEISDITKKHEIAVLVKQMMGTVDDIGKYNSSKYKRADVYFTSIQKGWKNYQQEIDKKGRLDHCLKALGYDTDKDGTISDKEIAAISGKLNLNTQRIEDVSRLKHLSDKVTELDLSGNQIKSLPKGFFDNMTNLKNLFLENNLLTALPEHAFRNNKNLARLDIASNKIKYFDKDLFYGLENVWSFDLGKNQVSSLDKDQFKDCKGAQELNIGEMKLKKLPKGLFKGFSDKLTFVNVSLNQLTELPSDINGLRGLKQLYCRSNRLTSLSNIKFSNMPNLTTVNAMKNYITSLPKNIWANNPKIMSVDLHDNLLTSVSASMLPAGMKNMHQFDISMNNINVVDPALVKKIKSWNKLYPQKSFMNLKLSAKNIKKANWSSRLTILDIRYWSVSYTHLTLPTKRIV